MISLHRAIALFLLILAASAQAEEAPQLRGEAAERIYAGLQAVTPPLPVVSIAPAPIPGLYAVELENSELFYATSDADYLIAGDLFAVAAGKLVNRTDQIRSARRASLLATVSRDELIIFPANGKRRGLVNVFTDVDCGFCQRLHREVPALNDLGIEVRYFAYPRAGPDSLSADKLMWAWCSRNPRAAMTRLKSGLPVEQRSCANPVAAQFRLGQRLGVRGTPALFLADGRILPGYRPAAALAAELGLGRAAEH